MSDVNAELAWLDQLRAQGQIDQASYEARRAALTGGGYQQGPGGQPGYDPQGYPPPGYPPQGGQQYNPYGQQAPYGQYPGGPPRSGPQPLIYVLIAAAVLALGFAVYWFAIRDKSASSTTVTNTTTTAPATGPAQPPIQPTVTQPTTTTTEPTTTTSTDTTTTVDTSGQNPLLGTWVGTNSTCVGARWVFTASDVTVYPPPGSPNQPKNMTGVTYTVQSATSVQTTLNGVTDTFTITDGAFTVGGCSFQKQNDM